MKVILTNGEHREIPITNCYGYVVAAVMIEPKDIDHMMKLAARSPETFQNVMAQLKHRFPSQRVGFKKAEV